MGGKALKNIETERKSTKDFLRIGEELNNIVTEKLRIETHIVKFYHTKETHGDLDMLLKTNSDIDVRKFIEENINPNELQSNAVYSFDYDKFQIDFIPVNETDWEVSKCFFDYDPTGNLMGKIAHRFGLKYGFKGLVYPFRNFSGRLNDDIVISKDLPKIFDFLGFDYDRYSKGFDTVEEIFDYVINSEYFNPKYFDMDNLYGRDRKRNKKRKTYQEFLKYIKDNNLYDGHKWKSKDEYIDLIDSSFPESNLKERLKELKRIDDENKLLSEKFNGRHVMGWIGVEGKELGKILNNFRESLEDERSFILESEPNIIKNEFLKFYEENN